MAAGQSRVDTGPSNAPGGWPDDLVHRRQLPTSGVGSPDAGATVMPTHPAPRCPRQLTWIAAGGLLTALVLIVGVRPWLLSTFADAIAYERANPGRMHDMFSLGTTPGTGQGFMVGVIGVVVHGLVVPMIVWAATVWPCLRRTAVAHPLDSGDAPSRSRRTARRLVMAWMWLSTLGLMGLASYGMYAWRAEAEMVLGANSAFLLIAVGCLVGLIALARSWPLLGDREGVAMR